MVMTMMKVEIWDEMQALIRKYRTWIDVLDTDKSEDFYFIIGGTIQLNTQRVLRLITKRHSEEYSAGHIFCIPECEIDRAIRENRHNRKFTHRIKKRQPTPEDIQLIIHRASMEQINLALELY